MILHFYVLLDLVPPYGEKLYDMQELLFITERTSYVDNIPQFMRH